MTPRYVYMVDETHDILQADIEGLDHIGDWYDEWEEGGYKANDTDETSAT